MRRSPEIRAHLLSRPNLEEGLFCRRHRAEQEMWLEGHPASPLTLVYVLERAGTTEFHTYPEFLKPTKVPEKSGPWLQYPGFTQSTDPSPLAGSILKKINVSNNNSTTSQAPLSQTLFPLQ